MSGFLKSIKMIITPLSYTFLTVKMIAGTSQERQMVLPFEQKTHERNSDCHTNQSAMIAVIHARVNGKARLQTLNYSC